MEKQKETVKNWSQRPHNKELEAIFLKQGQKKLLARLLAQREIDPNSIKKFISSDYQDLSHPFTLHDVEKAAKIFLEVAKNKGVIAVTGDYDLDGVVASVMLRELCHSLGLPCSVFIPHRINHGYGLNPKTVKSLIESFEKSKKIPDLLFVTDCGTNSFNEIQQLKEYGIKKIIILDHHLANKQNVATNADALISWHFGGNYEMCSCGEVFQFIRGLHQLNNKITPTEFLAYAALGTIADCSPVIGDNRIIVKNGLTSYCLNHVLSSGLTALMKQSRINAPALTAMDVSFKIAPKINAVGRLGDANEAYLLLIERDTEIADQMAQHISLYNDERKAIQKKIEKEAIDCAEIEIAAGNATHGILVWCKGWKIGVVGIVASKLTEEYGKPALVIGNNGEILKGSGRSIKGVNLKEILDTCPEIFEAYGGHAGAVGVTLKSEFKNDASRIFNEACKNYFEKHGIKNEQNLYYDAKLNAKAINHDISKMLSENLYPYCATNNIEPVFMIPDVTITDVTFKEDTKGIWRLMTFNIFRGEKVECPFKVFNPKWGSEIEGRKADIYFSFPQESELKQNSWAKFEIFCSDIVLK